jgi:hypothetical protein
VIGLRYRRKAGDGGPLSRGRRSSVSSGVIVKRDRVRKSSGCTDGVAKFDTDCAADLIALSEAVRFDLKLDPNRGKPRDVVLFLVDTEGGDRKMESRESTTSVSKSG